MLFHYLTSLFIPFIVCPNMASITKKIIRGKPYYYARESARIDGKPKIIWQKYLGKADDIISTLSKPPVPQQVSVRDFGAVVALLDIARKLRLCEHIDHHVPKRTSPSVGTYLLTSIINRCVAPSSKAATARWFADTVLEQFIDVEPRQLTSQRFWDNMDRVSPEAISSIERDCVGEMVRVFDVDISQVLFDATNFFTFINSFNDRCTLAQRGHSKEGRKSLRIVGLALLVSADGPVPLLHSTYQGNQTDAPMFRGLVDSLVQRYREISEQAENVTIVFDKGNNARDNLEAVNRSPYHVIGSLVPTHHPELLAVPEHRFTDVEGIEGVRAWRSRHEVWGVEQTVLVTWNKNLYDSQVKTLLREIARRRKLLRDLACRLRKWRSGKITAGRRPAVSGTKKKVEQWLKARHMKDLFCVDITEVDGFTTLHYRFNKSEWERLRSTLLGKTLIFTDNHHWSDEEIVRGYRAQYHVESAFRDMKNVHHIALRPQYHWTDQKIRVHVLCCVLAFMLCSLLRREVRGGGLEMSTHEILEQLGGIREVMLFYPPSKWCKEPQLHKTHTHMNQSQQALCDTLDLGKYMTS